MKQLLIGAVAIVAVIALGCTGGDKQTSAWPTEAADATRAVPSSSSDSTSAPMEAGRAAQDPSTSRSGGGIGTLFNAAFSSGLTGGFGRAAMPGLGSGDESLMEFLPSDADLPDGFMRARAFSFSAPAGTSEFGAMDMAMTVAMKGDTGTPAGASPDASSVEMLMAMVIRPEDLQKLGEAFESIEGLSEEEIQEQINGSLERMPGFEVTRFEVLDASGLGDGGFGMEMTIDMSGFVDSLGGVGAGAGAPEFGVMTMRMYMFGHGDYMGAVMRMGFADTLDGAGEDLEIAEIIEGKLGA